MADDQFKYWRQCLAAPDKIGTEIEIANEAQPGYWRRKRSRKAREADPSRPYDAVAMYYGKDGRFWCQVNGKHLRPEGSLSVLDLASEMFPWVVRYPITYEAHNEFLATGRWADVPPPAERQPVPEPAKAVEAEKVPEPETGPGLGHNQPPADETPEQREARELQEKLASLYEERIALKKFLETPVDTQDRASQAAELATRIGVLATWFAKRHKALKAPILEAGRVLDANYLRPAEAASELAREAVSAANAWARAEDERRRQKAAEANAAAVQEAAEKGEAPPPPVQQPAPVTVGGATGRKATLQTVKVGVVLDYAKLALHLIQGGDEKAPINTCAHAKLRDLLDGYANQSAKAFDVGTEQHGYRVEEKKEMRR